MKHKGVICGILAAVCYGTNPFGALPLYEEGVNTSSVLFYRFSMAVLMLAVMLLIERKSFRVTNFAEPKMKSRITKFVIWKSAAEN